jgi:UDP-glucose 4-epimerase
MKVLVTGGLGFLGRPIAAALVHAGHEVRIMDNGSRPSPLGPLPYEVELMEGDVRDAARVGPACRGCELVLHLAAVQGTESFYRMPDAVLDVNLRGILNIATACGREGVRRLFFSSSSEVYGVPERFPTPENAPLCVPDVLNARYSYAGSKLAGELVAVNFARQGGFEFTIVRYHNVYGPAMGWAHVIPQFIRRLELDEEFTVQGDGKQTRAFCYVDDAARASLAAAMQPAGANEIFNIGNPREEHTINELIKALAQISGRPISPVYLPFPGEGTRRRVPDIERARRLLGYEPIITLAEGLDATYRWYAAQLQAQRSEVGG